MTKRTTRISRPAGRILALALLATAMAGAACPASAATFEYVYTGQSFGPSNNGLNTLPGATHISVDFFVPSLFNSLDNIRRFYVAICVCHYVGRSECNFYF